MSRNPEDIFSTGQSSIFSDDVTDIFIDDTAVNAKNKSVIIGVQNKNADLGTTSEVDVILQRALNRLDPNFRTDPNSILTDREARRGFGPILNLGGALVSGVGNLTNTILGAPENLDRAITNSINAQNASRAIAVTAAKRALLGLPPLPDELLSKSEVKAKNLKSVSDTKAELLGLPKIPSAAEQLTVVGEEIKKSSSKLFNPVNVQQLAEDAGIAFDNADGFIESTVALAKVAASDLTASAEIFAQSLPQMIALATKGSIQAVTFLSVTAERMDESRKIFVDKFDREPTREETANLVATSITQSIIDIGASKVVLGKKLPGTAENILTTAAEKITGNAVGKVVSKVPGVKSAGKITGAAATEGVDESSQGVLSKLGGEQDLSILSDPKVHREAFQDAALGAGPGGVGRVPTVIHEGLRDTAVTGIEISNPIRNKLARKGDVKTAVAAIKSGNAVDIIETVPDVDLTGLSADERRAILNPLVQAEDALRESAKNLEGEARQEALQELKTISERNTNIVNAHNKLVDEEAGVTTDISEITQLPEDTTKEEAQKIIGRKFGSAGFRSDLDEKSAQELRDSKVFIDNASSETIKELDLMLNTFKKTAKGVSDEILNGDDLGIFKGANQYLDDLNSAIGLDNKGRAAEAVAGIEAFTRRQAKKATTILSGITAIQEADNISLKDELTAAQIDEQLGTNLAETLGPNFVFDQRTPQFVRKTIIGKDIVALRAVLAQATNRFNNVYGSGAKATTQATATAPKADTGTKTTPVEPKEKKVADTSTQEASQDTVPAETSLQKAKRETAEAKNKPKVKDDNKIKSETKTPEVDNKVKIADEAAAKEFDAAFDSPPSSVIKQFTVSGIKIAAKMVDGLKSRNKRDGSKSQEILASRNSSTGEISLNSNQDFWVKKFKDKAWNNPVLLGEPELNDRAAAINKDTFSSVTQLKKFVLLHEHGHSLISKDPDETIGEYETRVNNYALDQLGLRDKAYAADPDSTVRTEAKTDRRQKTTKVKSDKREGKDRRLDQLAADTVAKMSRAELEKLVLSNELTGIKNRFAFNIERDNADVFVSIDADSLKWINDNMTPDNGDKLLQLVADALVEEFGKERVYHISGDEFYVLGFADNDAPLLLEGMARVDERLSQAVLHVTKPNGSNIVLRGVAVTTGTGDDKVTADTELKQIKQEKEDAGTRSPRGEAPSGATRTNAEGQQDTQGDITLNEGDTSESEVSQESDLSAEFILNNDTFSALKSLGGKLIGLIGPIKNKYKANIKRINTLLKEEKKLVRKLGSEDTGKLLTIIASIGGLFPEESDSDLLKPANSVKRSTGGKSQLVFKHRDRKYARPGKDIDSMLEALNELGFNFNNISELQDAIDEALAGNEIVSNEFADQQFEIDNIRNEISSLEADNQSLAADIDELTQNTPKVNKKIDVTSEVKKLEEQSEKPGEVFESTQAPNQNDETNADPDNEVVILEPTKKSIKGETVLGERLLVNGVPDPDTDLVSSDLFQATKDVVGGLLSTVPNLLSKLNSGEINGQLSDTVSPEDLSTTLRFINSFVVAIQGTGNGKNSLIAALNFQKLLKTSSTRPGAVAANPMLHLLQTTPNGEMVFNQNLLTTMALVSSNFLATRAAATLFNTDDDINSILGKPKSSSVSANVRTLLAYKGSVAPKVAENLGSMVMARINLEVKDNIDGTLETRLQQAIGLTMIEVMINQGHLETDQVDIGKIKTGKPGLETSFIRIADDKSSENLAVSPVTSQLINAFVATYPVTDLLIEMPNRDLLPTSEPSENTYTKQKQKGNGQNIPKDQQRNMEKINQTAFGIKPNILSLLNFFGLTGMQQINGYTSNLKAVNKDNLDSVKGKNLDITRAINNAIDFILSKALKEELDDSIFFEQVVFKQTRFSSLGSVISPAGNKIQRHIFAAKADTKTVTTKRQRETFMYSVMQAFGSKIDKQTQHVSEAAFNNLLLSPVVQNAITAITAIESGRKLTSAETILFKQQIFDAVSLGGEKTHTLDALSALTKYKKDAPFESNLAGEFDSITSGAALLNTQIMKEDNSTEISAATGVHIDGTRDNGEWFSKEGNKDIYEQFAESWKNKVIDLFEGDTVAKGVETLIGTMNEATNIIESITRNTAKNPVTVTTFGARVKTTRKAFADDTVNGIPEQLTKFQNDPVELRRIIDSINAIADGAFTVPYITSRKEALDFVLTNKGKRLLAKNIDSTFGVALEEALKETVTKTNIVRNLGNLAINTMFKAFDVRYKAEIANALEANNGEPLTNTKEKEIFNSLQKYLPIIKTPLSEEAYKDGILFIKTKREPTGAQVQIVLTNPRKSNGAKSVTGRGSKKVYTDAGVAGIIGLLHSMDSAINQKVLATFEGLHLQDAVMINSNDLIEAAYLANKTFYEVNKDYSILGEVETSFNRVMKLLQDNHPLEFDFINGQLNEEKTEFNNVADIQTYLRSTVESTNEQKLEQLNNQNITVANYGWAGSNTAYRPSEDPNSELFKSVEEGFTPQTEDGFIAEIQDDIDALIQDINKQLGSSAEGIDLGIFDSVNGDPLTSDNALEIFDDIEVLGTQKESTENQSYLRGVINNLIRKGLEPLSELNVKFRATGTETVGAVADVDVNGTVTPTVFVATSTGVTNNAVQMSAQEVFTHELIHMVTRFALDDPKNFALRKQILKLFKEVEKVATVDMFLPEQGPHTAETLAAAQARFDYIFNNSKTQTNEVSREIYNTTNDFLHEFVAFGMTNEKVRRILSKVDATVTTEKTPDTLLEKLEAWWNSVLDWFAGRVTKTNNLQGDEALTSLVQQLTVLHEGKRQSILNHIGVPAEYNQKLVSAWRATIWKPMLALKAKYPNPSRINIPGKLFNGTVAMFEHPEEYGKTLNQVRKNLGLTENNFFVQNIREGIGITADIIKFHTLLRLSKKLIDQERKHIAEEVSAGVRAAFLKDFTKEEAKSINRVMLKADLITLFDNGYTQEQIVELLSDNAKLQTEINTAEANLAQYAEAGYYADQAVGLGRLMATGQTHIDGQSLNTNIIANLSAVDNRATLQGDMSARRKDIEILATLFALDYTNRADRSNTAEVIKKEFESDPEFNGIINLNNMHRLAKSDALAMNFKGNPNLTIKGFTSEIFNPAIDIKVVPQAATSALRKEQQQEMAQAGYIPVSDVLTKDIKDPNTTDMVLYARRDATDNTWLKSIAGLTAERVKGTTLADAYLNEGTEGANTAAILARNTVRTREALLVDRQFNVPTATRKGKTNKLVPIRNESGTTVGYRYLMSEATKVQVLEKDDNFVSVIGQMHGNIIDKKNTKEINRRLVRLNKEDFTDNFAKDPSAFIEISASSALEQHREIFNLFPDDMKAAIRETFPRGKMWVRASTVDLQFGYRKFTVSNTAVGEFVNNIFNAILPGSRYKNIVGNAEQLWQGTVNVAKDFIVVKSAVVLAGNVMSNELLLLAKGVPLGDTFSQQATALRALDSFMADSKQQRALERELASSTTLSTTQREKKKVELARLLDSMAANPVKSLVDEGIFQSIAEDIDENDINDQYSNRNQLLAAFEKRFPNFDKVPDNVRSVRNAALQTYKYGYFTHDTGPYKLLLRGTQYSDFIARFALYNHQIANGVSHEAALADVIETFINYDIPTNKFMQYMNDMGILLFTKFLFRIQRVILKSMKGQPANNLALYSIQSVLGDMSDVPDQFILTHGLISTIDDIIPNATTAAGYEAAKSSIDAAGSIF